MTIAEKIQELVDAREIKRLADDFYEDLGGHVVHESNLGPYFEAFEKELHGKIESMRITSLKRIHKALGQIIQRKQK